MLIGKSTLRKHFRYLVDFCLIYLWGTSFHSGLTLTIFTAHSRVQIPWEQLALLPSHTSTPKWTTDIRSSVATSAIRRQGIMSTVICVAFLRLVTISLLTGQCDLSKHRLSMHTRFFYSTLTAAFLFKSSFLLHVCLHKDSAPLPNLFPHLVTLKQAARTPIFSYIQIGNLWWYMCSVNMWHVRHKQMMRSILHTQIHNWLWPCKL